MRRKYVSYKVIKDKATKGNQTYLTPGFSRPQLFANHNICSYEPRFEVLYYICARWSIFCDKSYIKLEGYVPKIFSLIQLLLQIINSPIGETNKTERH